MFKKLLMLQLQRPEEFIVAPVIHVTHAETFVQVLQEA